MNEGPLVFAVSGVNGQTIAPAGVLGPVRFEWPTPVFCKGFLLLTRSGLAADVAGLSLAITDERQEEIFVTQDGIGGAAPALPFGGLTLPFWPFPFIQPCQLQRPVLAGMPWYFTLTNNNAGAVIPNLFLLFDEMPS